jgi:hypothetical protein
MRRNRGNAILLVCVVTGLAIAGLAVHGPVGGILLLVVAAVAATATTQAWPHIRREGKPVRVVILAALLVIAVLKLAGRL